MTKGVGGTNLQAELAGIGPWPDRAPPITLEERLGRIEHARRLMAEAAASKNTGAPKKQRKRGTVS